MAEQQKQYIELTRDELKDLMEEAVHDAFVKMGIDMSKPLEMQKDFQHLRDWRLSVQSVKDRSLFAVITVLVTGTLGAIWLGLQQIMRTGGGQ